MSAADDPWRTGITSTRKEHTQTVPQYVWLCHVSGGDHYPLLNLDTQNASCGNCGRTLQMKTYIVVPHYDSYRIFVPLDWVIQEDPG